MASHNTGGRLPQISRLRADQAIGSTNANTMGNYPQRTRQQKGLLQQFTPLDLSPSWERGEVIKVRGVRVIALSGHATYSDREYVIEQAVGCIEVIGNRVATRATVLLIGFTLAADIPPATFRMTEDEAIGTMTLPASCLSAYIMTANSPAAYFRMGGDGSLNALATDASSLRTHSAIA